MLYLSEHHLPPYHLHLGVEMAHPLLLLQLLLAAVLLHLPDGVQEEQDEDRDEDIEVVEELSLQAPYQAGSQHLGPDSEQGNRVPSADGLSVCLTWRI